MRRCSAGSPSRARSSASSSRSRSTPGSTCSAGFQFEEKWLWIERFNIHYHLGVDGISVLFVLLNSFITILVVIAGWSVIDTRVGQYYGAFLIMSGLLNGVFAALDAVLFYVFFEGTLIPMFIIIGVWGGPNRVYAAVKFFLYTLLGSLLMLVAMLYLYNKSGGSFAITDWHRLPLSLARADGALLRLPLRLRGQGADVAGAHLAARRAHRGADRRLGGARGDPAEARRLRLRALHAADPAGRLARARLADDRAVARRDRLHRPGDAGADRHEAPHRLLVGLAHGLRHARLLHLQRLRGRGRPGADDLARLRLGGDVPLRRRALRPHAHPHDRRLRRGGEHDAQVRRAS